MAAIKPAFASYTSDRTPHMTDATMVIAGETVVIVLMLSTEYPSSLIQIGKPLFEDTPSACEKKNANATRTYSRQLLRI